MDIKIFDKNYHGLPLFLNAKAVSQALGVSISNAYELPHKPGAGREKGQPDGGSHGELHSVDSCPDSGQGGVESRHFGIAGQ